MHLYLISILVWSFIVVTSLALFPLAAIIRLLTHFFDRRLIVQHKFTCFWASLYTWFNPFWSVNISGRERIRSNETYIMVCNHQSLVDILVLFRLFTHFKWVSKIENFRVPLVGWNMSMNRYIKLTRGSMKSQARMMKDCKATLMEGSTVLIFPEGTRTKDGNLLPFKTGAFELALRTKRPLLPMVLNGSSDALPKAGIKLQGKHIVEVRILEEIPYEEYADLNSKELTREMQALIDKELRQMRGQNLPN